MSCKNFWIGILPFFLTFSIGILVVGLFVFNDTSDKNIVSQVEQNLYLPSDSMNLPELEKSKKCVPVKTNLKEQKEFYTLNELSIINLIDKRVELESQLENNNNLTKEEEKKIQRNIENTKTKVDLFLNKTKTKIMGGEGSFVKPIYLIYLEKCFEN